jgi:hypothetical protein
MLKKTTAAIAKALTQERNYFMGSQKKASDIFLNNPNKVISQGNACSIPFALGNTLPSGKRFLGTKDAAKESIQQEHHQREHKLGR